MSLFSAGFIKAAKDWGLVDDVRPPSLSRRKNVTLPSGAVLGGRLPLPRYEGARGHITQEYCAAMRARLQHPAHVRPTPNITTVSLFHSSSIARRSPGDMRRKFPWLRVDDISCGALGVKNEGWFDPWQLLFGFKKSAGKLGVKFVTGEVTGVNHRSACAESVVVNTTSCSSATIPCDILINAAGPWAASITSLGIISKLIFGSVLLFLLSLYITSPSRAPPPLRTQQFLPAV
jgi:glycine/D-amino acid oxidase-like deaminating enzyme